MNTSNKTLPAVVVGMSNVMSCSKQVTAEAGMQMTFFERSSWLYGDYQRNLVNEAVGTFQSLQKACEEVAQNDIRPILLKKSREYRSLVQACVGEMNQELEKESSEKEVLKDNCELLYKMELILGLIEILFIDARPGTILLSSLLSWIRLHFPLCRQRMAECLASEQPHLHPKYWEACYGLVLQGLLDEAKELLKRHPSFSSDAFLSMDEILRKMPTYQPYSGVSEAEFTMRWHHWQNECEARLNTGHFATNSNLEIICKFLCGDQETLQKHTMVVDTWYHLMVSNIMFTNPSIRMHRLPTAAQQAITMCGADPHLGALDHMLIAIIELNQQQVIRLCHTVLGNIWFAVHLCDLIFHSLDGSPDQSQLGEVRECLLSDYGCELLSHKSLWQASLVYLDWCQGGPSSSLLESVLERIPLISHQHAVKVIDAAEKRCLDGVVLSVCRVMGRQALQREQMGAAIWWAVRSRDANFTSQLAHKILQKYMSDGEFESSSLLDHLGPSMLLSDTLTFLGKYREFHVLYQNGEVKEAATLLVSLISSRLAPEYFWPVLLEDALPLLESSTLVFSTEQTYSLMYCLHNLSLNESTKSKTKSINCSNLLQSKEHRLRTALTTNLAKAIILEGTRS